MDPKVYKKYVIEKELPRQPEKCRGCIEGRWEGTVQFCPKQKCVRDQQTSAKPMKFPEWKQTIEAEDAEFHRLSHEEIYVMYQSYRESAMA